jgi:2-hydroxychromene-2-carboxylate isomerase
MAEYRPPALQGQRVLQHEVQDNGEHEVRQPQAGAEVERYMSDADIHFYFDPVCPFAWMTSKWVRVVQAQRGYTVDWRFISLRMINAAVDYDSHFPAGYEAGHTAGLKLLHVASRTRAEHGRDAVGPLYAAIGARVFDTAADPDQADGGYRGTRAFLEPILAEAGLPADLADALDDDSFDAGIRQETDEALALTGQDVGTPIIQFQPPAGVAFFGPVISRLPTEAEAVPLWDHVLALVSFPGFAELKRSLRERPQLRSFGVEPGPVGIQEDWHGGSRRVTK